MSIVCVGSMAIDFITTPFGKADAIVGGANPFITIAASHFVPDVHLVGVVGGDFPKEFLTYLKGRNIDLAGLQIKEEEKSFSWTGSYHQDMNGRDTVRTDLNVLADFDPVLPEAYRNAEYVMLGNLAPQVQMKVLDQMHTRPKLVVLDTMDFWMNIALDELKAVIARVDVLTINDEEARLLSGKRSLSEAAKVIHALGVPYLVVKRGEHGALLMHKNQAFSAPALLLEQVTDPTGAGDTFAGGFIGYMAKSGDVSFENMKRAIICGSTMASFCVEKFGVDGLKGLEKSEINNRLNQLLDQMQIQDFEI